MKIFLVFFISLLCPFFLVGFENQIQKGVWLMTRLPLQYLRSGAKEPVRSTPGSAGYDIAACIDTPVVINPGEAVFIPTGFAVAVDSGFAAFLYARSGLGTKHGIVPANCVGVIDSDYRGEVQICLRNHSETAFTVSPGDRVAQMLIMPCITPDITVCDNLDATKRGGGGFGSTG
jgi:dUTP pyrophosphatase